MSKLVINLQNEWLTVMLQSSADKSKVLMDEPVLFVTSQKSRVHYRDLLLSDDKQLANLFKEKEIQAHFQLPASQAGRVCYYSYLFQYLKKIFSPSDIRAIAVCFGLDSIMVGQDRTEIERIAAQQGFQHAPLSLYSWNETYFQMEKIHKNPDRKRVLVDFGMNQIRYYAIYQNGFDSKINSTEVGYYTFLEGIGSRKKQKSNQKQYAELLAYLNEFTCSLDEYSGTRGLSAGTLQEYDYGKRKIYSVYDAKEVFRTKIESKVQALLDSFSSSAVTFFATGVFLKNVALQRYLREYRFANPESSIEFLDNYDDILKTGICTKFLDDLSTNSAKVELGYVMLDGSIVKKEVYSGSLDSTKSIPFYVQKEIDCDVFDRPDFKIPVYVNGKTVNIKEMLYLKRNGFYQLNASDLPDDAIVCCDMRVEGLTDEGIPCIGVYHRSQKIGDVSNQGTE